MVEIKKKSWLRRHWILTTILALFGFFIILGIIGGIASDSNSGADEQNYPCPDLSNMKLQGYDNLMQTWTAQISSYKSENAEVVYTYNSQVEENRKIIYCDAGSDEGQNANWVYCGDFIRPIVMQYIDDTGSIIKKRSVEVTFDKNTKQYLATTCDTYDLF